MFFLRVRFPADQTSGLGARKVNVKVLGDELVHVYLAHRRIIHRTAFSMHGSTRTDMILLRVQFQTDRTSGLGARKVIV